MKRLKGSVKAIIISVVAVVCIASIVLGCILGIKHPNDPNNPTYPNIHEGLSKDQINLGTLVQETNSATDYLKEFDNSHIVDNYGNHVDIEYVNKYYDFGFSVYLDTNKTKEMFYIYPKIVDDTNYKTISLKDLTDKNFSYVTDLKVFDDKIAFIAYYDNSNYAEFICVKLNNNNEIESTAIFELVDLGEVLGYRYNDKLTYWKKIYYVIGDSVYIGTSEKDGDLFTCLFLFVYRMDQQKIDVYITDGEEWDIIDKLYYDFSGDSIFFNHGTKLRIESFNTGEMVYTEIDLDKDIDYSFDIFSNGIFIKESSREENLSKENIIASADGYFSYSFKCFSFNTNKLSNIVLESGCVFASFSEISDDLGFLTLEEYKIDERHEIIYDNYYLNYYDDSSNKIISFFNKSNNIFQVKGFYGNKFLTTAGIYTVNNSKEANCIFEFINDKRKLTLNSNLNNSSFTVKDNDGNIYILNLNGEYVFSKGFDKVTAFEGGYYLAKSNEEYYILNTNYNTISKIDNFFNDDEKSTETLAFEGPGMYFIYESDNTYTLKNFKGETILDKVIEFNFETKNNNSYLEVNTTTKSLTYINNLKFTNVEFVELSEDEKNYYLNIIKNNTVSTYAVGDYNYDASKEPTSFPYQESKKASSVTNEFNYYGGSMVKNQGVISIIMQPGFYPSGQQYFHLTSGCGEMDQKLFFSYYIDGNTLKARTDAKNETNDDKTSDNISPTYTFSLVGDETNGYSVICKITGGRSNRPFEDDCWNFIKYDRTFMNVNIYNPNGSSAYSSEMSYGQYIGYNNYVPSYITSFHRVYYRDCIINNNSTNFSTINIPLNNTIKTIAGATPSGFSYCKHSYEIVINQNLQRHTYDKDNNLFILNIGSGGDTKKWLFYHNSTGNQITLNYLRHVYMLYTPNTYTIELSPENEGLGEDGTKEISLLYNTSWSVNKITCPTRVGYTFQGYYTGKNGEGTHIIRYDGTVFSNQKTFTTRDTKLYANWTANMYSIRFELSHFIEGHYYGYDANDLNKDPINYSDSNGTKGSIEFNHAKNSFIVGDETISFGPVKIGESFSSVIEYTSDKFLNILEKVRVDGFSTWANLDYTSSPTISVINSANIFDGWYYVAYTNNSSGVLKDLDTNTTFQNLIEKSSIQYGDASINNEKTIVLYAKYSTKSYYIAGENASSGGSLNLNGNVDDINSIPVSPYLDWKVEYSGLEKDFDNTTIYDNNFNYNIFHYAPNETNVNNKIIPPGGGTITITLNIPKNASLQMYKFDRIELRNFAYRSRATAFATTVVTIYYDNGWKIKNSNNASHSGDISTGVIIGNNDNNTNYNVIKISNVSTTSITIEVSNCMIGTNSSGESPSQAGEYGFTCVPYVCSNYTANDSVKFLGIGSSSTTVNAIDITGLNGFWINNNYYNQTAVSKGYCYKINDNGQLSNRQPLSSFSSGSICRIGDIIYYSSDLKMNFNTTQLIAISPNQISISGSMNSLSQRDSGFYSMTTYLSQIQFGANSIAIPSLTRDLAKDNLGNYYYSNLKFKNETSKADKESIVYIDGETYTVMDSMIITIDNERTYILYLTVNLKNNKVMYFLYSDMNNKEPENNPENIITLTFANFDNKITITNSIDGDKYSTNDKGVEIKNFNGSSYNNLVDDKITIQPSSLTMLSFTPQNGYLINSILVKLKGEILYQFTLNRNGIDLHYSNGVYSLISSVGGITNHINYKVEHYYPYISKSSNVDIFNGIYCAGYRGAVWRSISNELSAFETLYLMISDVYDDVEITVSAVSYAEYDFILQYGYKLEIDPNNNTYFKIINEDNKQTGALSFAVKNGNNWDKINNNIPSLLKVDDASVYRLVFVGNASILKNGVRFYASGKDFSYGFNNGRFADGKTAALGLGEIQQLVFEITPDSNSNSIFDKYEKLGDYSDYISSKLNIFGVTLNDKEITINSTSYLSNKGGYNDANYLEFRYQIDDTSKLNSWFNDTVLTNIDYNFFADQKGQISKINWQSQIIGTTIDGQVVYVYDVDKLNSRNMNNISSAACGYGLTFEYYEIPGYYLQYISINNIFIRLSDLSTKINIDQNLNEVSISSKAGEISYTITYNKSEAKFTITLFKDGDTIENEIDSIESIKNNLQIDFYSMPYSIKINYLPNNTDSSTADTYNILAAIQDNLIYDTMGQLEGLPTMSGYTFAGWGSSYIIIDGYEQQRRGWNSSSLWTDPSSLFKPNNRNELLDLKTTTRKENFSYYVPNGYFISDTGFSGTQNYNFFLDNKNEFMNTVGGFGSADARAINIYLYAIWKANTYRIDFNLNDASINNGTTIAYLSKSSSVFSNNSIVTNGVITAGNLKNASNIVYYAYVTFDSDDWYITTHDFSFKHDSTDMVTDIGGSENLLDIIVDRYGYSWLGWTSEKFGNNKDESINQTVFASKFNPNKTVAPLFDKELYEKLNSTGILTASDRNINPNFYYHGQPMVSYDNSGNEVISYRGCASLSQKDILTDVVFYRYAASGIWSVDYLNNKNNSSNIANFDTSLNYEAYSYVDGKIYYNNDTSNYRGLTLYAYWHTNKYTFEINYRDVDETAMAGNLQTSLGTSKVTNKSTLADYYFDDPDFANAINRFNPVRIGYDFVGWAYRFASLTESAYGNMFTETNYLNNLLLTSYSTTSSDLVNNVLSAGEYNDNEILGDYEKEHKVYLFAIWKAQKYTINFSLNISGSELKNLYDKDSNFAVALYNSNTEGYDGTYQAINQLGFKNIDASREHTFSDIIANVVFTATFDDLIGNSYFEIGGKTYQLKDLYTTSAGYYFIGWLYDSTNRDSLNNSTDIVHNNLKSTFDKDGLLNNKFEDGITSIDSARTRFNYAMFMNLFNSNYKLDYTKDFLTDNKIYLNTIDISGKSTNYGYVTLEDGNNYYLAHEYISGGTGLLTSRLYYIKDGKKYFVRVGTVSNGVFTEINFDDAFMYLSINGNKHIIRFDNNGIYYINQAGERVSINLRCYRLENNEAITFTAKTTRQFTLYANWAIKEDLNIKIENGNNGISEDLEKPTPSNNNGLAGHYHISDKTNVNGVTTSNGIENEGTTAGFVEKNINLTFNYYNDLTYDIIPYFNGRYLSEMTLTYYAVEWNNQTNVYVEIPYTITFKFSWNSEKQTIDIASITVNRQGSVIVNAFEITSKVNKFNGYDNNILDASGIARLTMIDRTILENLKFIIDAYATGYSNLSDTYERRDINKLIFSLNKVGSNIDITCKFSVQTFEVDIYNLFDESGNTLMKREGSDIVYDTTYTDYASFQADVIASASGTGFEPLISKDPANYEYVIESLDKVQLATISNDCATDDPSVGYNVPYGYFLYGMYYDSDTFRPVDEMVDDVRVNVNQPYNGYEYIFANGIYTAGTTDVVLEGKGADSYYSQCSPIIGRPSAFPDQAYLHSSSTYQFFHWFEYTPDSSGNVVFTEYAKANGESKYVNRNITLYAYQYSENKPTSVQFYTWGTNSYTEINDGGKYTLNSNSSDSPYKLENNLVKPNLDKVGFTDENGLVRINTYSEYGVNRTKFVSDAYSNTEIRGDLDSGLMPKLLQTYWYYQESYDVLYFYKDLSALESNKKTYLKFDGEDFYIEDDGGARTIVILRSNKFESFSIVLNGETITLRTERLYTYDFAGAKMYVRIRQNGENRYYELKEVTDEENARYYASVGAMPIILNSNPRYYVDIEGVRYYTLLRNRSANSISSSAPADTLYTENAQEGLTDVTTTIVNINEYYAVYDSEYYKVNYRQVKDNGGSYFVNPYDQPYAKANTVSLIVKGQERVFYLNINNETLYLDEDFTEYPDLTPSVELYCAVNNSYAVSYGPGRLENYWEITGITINAVPDPNSGFWYPGTKSRVGFVTYIKFTTTDLEKLKQKETIDENQQRIYVVFNDYIDKNRYIDSRLSSLSDNAIENLKVAVSTRVSEYSLRDFLSQLIGVEKFNYENGVLKDIIANIPVTLRNITFDNDGETSTIDLSVTVKYQFDIIKAAQTRIDDNIYAIPIYSPFVMRFDNSVTTDNSAKKVSINTEKASVSHFERLGNNIHVYNDEEDPINFVLMTESQYLSWTACELPVDELTELIKNNAFDKSDLKSNLGLSAGAKNVEYDFAGKQGTYYIVMFYYKYYSNISIENRTQVIRVSDDAIKVVVSDTNITTEIVERKINSDG